MATALFRRVRGALGAERGFTLVELVVVAAILALLIVIALPYYVGQGNKSAIDEANGMVREWQTLAYGCYLRTFSPSLCNSDMNIGFNEQPGKFWNWTSSTVNGIAGDTYAANPTSTIVVSWNSTNAGLENGETYLVSMFVSGPQQGQSSATCIPNGC